MTQRRTLRAERGSHRHVVPDNLSSAPHLRGSRLPRRAVPRATSLQALGRENVQGNHEGDEPHYQYTQEQADDKGWLAPPGPLLLRFFGRFPVGQPSKGIPRLFRVPEV